MNSCLSTVSPGQSLAKRSADFLKDVNFFPMNVPWDTQNMTEDLANSYKLFSDLRTKGIRAHSWP